MTSLMFMQKYELFVRSHISGVQINIKIIHGVYEGFVQYHNYFE